MASFAEFFDHLGIERRKIRRLAAGYQAVVHDDFTVHPFRSCVALIGLQAWSTCDGLASNRTDFNQRPGSMADGRKMGLPASTND